ncbi:MAG: 3-deoxy-D-manno-octulosonic acid transferase, partial [Kiloniellales bacterium]
ARLQQQLGSRPRWLAASTHPGEERLVAAAQRALAAKRPGLLAILVPRHPQRGAALASSLSGEGFAVALRSRGEAPAPESEVYIADTIGELGLWYRLAPVAFVGGSLVPHGGQNPLEAAKLGSAVVTGPHTENFARIAGEMERAGALIRVADAAALGEAVARLLDDEAVRERQVAAAADYARHEALVLERISAAIEPLLAKARKAGPAGGN